MSTPTAASATRGAGSAVQTPTTGGRQRHSNNGPSSTGPASAGGTYRTPNTASKANRRTPGTAGRTPHARAARLALDSRRTAIFTPGGRQSRRKSGRMLRDSPRDLLRNLSRRLAPVSQPIASSSSPGSSGGSAQQSRRHRQPLDVDMEMDMMGAAAAGADSSTASATRRRTIRSVLGMDDDDDDDSLPLDRPRMSLNIEDNDNDDDLRPHRSLILENGGGSDDAEAEADADLANFTMRSIELARRAATQEQLLQARRFSRASLGVRSSLGSMRMSDYMDEFGRGADGGGNEIGGGGDDDIAGRLDQQSAFFPEGAFDNLLPGESADMTFERVDSDTGEQHEARIGADGRESGFGVVDLGLDGGNETTFMLGQQSPDRTLGTLLLEGDGENEPGLLDNNHDAVAGDFGAALDTNLDNNFDDYGGGNENGGNFWDESDSNNENDPEGVAALGHNAAAKAPGVTGSGQETGADARGAGKRMKLSAHGIAYPSLPVGVIKRIAQTFAQRSGAAGPGKAKLSRETVAALSTASDWFFEQVGVDLQRYAKHAGRKTIDESDVLLLMRRQRQVNSAVTPFSLAQRMLPRELLQELRMIPDAPALKRRQQKKTTRRVSSGPGRIGNKRAHDVT
ncbi:hypothetical protein HMPREF1624_04937 [Sporothrix schenckii ATCC 58251]|uniref:CENP-T/Histone H4 histone fold domain-containing protein n=1 Tax=Sporothrix schenckii (strain ATCC 58251 / de Perez 2211183) TaxID=1391915 RepID=U7PT85_SPOS1|nr:hypothetical protein HMPREF1624_04937 [Sporothrix schenckii ATCC 58251]